jgi:hypothetical protein
MPRRNLELCETLTHHLWAKLVSSVGLDMKKRMTDSTRKRWEQNKERDCVSPKMTMMMMMMMMMMIYHLTCNSFFRITIAKIPSGHKEARNC